MRMVFTTLLVLLFLAIAAIFAVGHRRRTRATAVPEPMACVGQLAREIGTVAPHSEAPLAIAAEVLKASESFRFVGVTPAVVLGIIEVESGFRPAARGRHGELGLMQLRGRRVVDLSVRPNIEHGVTYLVELHGGLVAAGIERRDEFHASLIAYNAGPSTLSPAGRKVSLRHYVKVRKAIARWRAKGY